LLLCEEEGERDFNKIKPHGILRSVIDRRLAYSCLVSIRVKLWHGDVGSHGSVWTAAPAAAATAGCRFECSFVGCDIVFFQAKMEGQGFQKQSTV
jgi:hypothetical protein